MPQIPNSMPDGDLEEGSASNLMDTTQGLCNESTLTRVEIIGALECVKASLLMNWRAERCDDEEHD